MANKYLEEYQKKLISADEAVGLVQSGDMLQYGEFTMFPFAFDAALARRVDE
ncbi:MAG: butyryl-CoA:acetate CoA-transferase, partial [Ignavibacteriales bacterium]